MNTRLYDVIRGVNYLEIYAEIVSPHFFDVQVEIDVRVNEPHQVTNFLRCEVWIFETE